MNLLKLSCVLIMSMLLWGCTAALAGDPPNDYHEFDICKYGQAGEWQTWKYTNPETGDRLVLVALYRLGDPHDLAHIWCVIPPGHPLMALEASKSS